MKTSVTFLTILPHAVVDEFRRTSVSLLDCDKWHFELGIRHAAPLLLKNGKYVYKRRIGGQIAVIGYIDQRPVSPKKKIIAGSDYFLTKQFFHVSCYDASTSFFVNRNRRLFLCETGLRCLIWMLYDVIVNRTTQRLLSPKLVQKIP